MCATPTAPGAAVVNGGTRRRGRVRNGRWRSARQEPEPCCIVRWYAIWYPACGGWMPSSTESYIELHAASAFSFLEGASLPEALIEQAAAYGMPAMALLDHNGFYGSAR